jgi:hypothetical protein
MTPELLQQKTSLSSKMLDNKPLTTEEMREASEFFFESFEIIQSKMPENSTTGDTLKVMEYVAKLATKQRSDREREKLRVSFGFSKKSDSE